MAGTVLLHELQLEYPVDEQEMMLLQLALDPTEQPNTTPTAVAQPGIHCTSGAKHSTWRTALIVALLAVVVFIVMSIPPLRQLAQLLPKGPIRLAAQVVVFSILVWLLVMLFM